MGLVNAHHLVEALARSPVEPALRDWDRARRPPTQRTQRSARAYDLATRFCPGWLEPARNGVLRLLDVPWVNARVLGLRAIEL
jgi:2-polyprenyl-6-methoxyphenol hydroxylase-like FAD-dependent oxidoreductase